MGLHRRQTRSPILALVGFMTMLVPGIITVEESTAATIRLLGILLVFASIAGVWMSLAKKVGGEKSNISILNYNGIISAKRIIIAVVISQIAGGIYGLFFELDQRLLYSVWQGAALASFPGFIAGIVLDNTVFAKEANKNRKFILLLGITGLLMSVFGLIVGGFS